MIYRIIQLEIDCLCLFLHHTIRSCHAGTTTSFQIVLNTQRNPYLNQATQKKLANFPIKKKIPDSKFLLKKILRLSLSPEHDAALKRLISAMQRQYSAVH